MEHFIKLAFLMVTITITISSPIRFEENNINTMRNEVKCPSDSSFYSAPKIIKDKCITAALRCIDRELAGTVKKECDDENEVIDQALEYLDMKIQQRKENSTEQEIPTECACERWPEASFSGFLDMYETLLQRENSM